MKKTVLQKPVLTPADLTALINKMKVVFPSRDEVRTIVKEELDAKIKNLPTKDEFFARMDKLSGEYKKIDEHDQRITALENRKASSPTTISYPNL